VDNRQKDESDQLTYTLGWQGAGTQEGSMAYSTKLPRRFPVGTKFVIESRRGGEGYSRHLEFPDGTFFPLPARPVPAELRPKAPISRRQSARRRRNRKG
jgi:hypothetical protein